MLTETLVIGKEEEVSISQPRERLWTICVSLVRQELEEGTYFIDEDENFIDLVSYEGGAGELFLDTKRYAITYIEYNRGQRFELTFQASSSFQKDIRGFLRKRMNNVE